MDSQTSLRQLKSTRRKVAWLCFLLAGLSWLLDFLLFNLFFEGQNAEGVLHFQIYHQVSLLILLALFGYGIWLAFSQSLAYYRQKEEAREHLIQAQSLASLGSWQWDLARQKLLLSSNERRLLGLSEEQTDLTLHDLVDRFEKEDQVQLQKALDQCHKDHQPFEIRHLNMNNGEEMRLINLRCNYLLDETGQPVALLGTMKDVSALVRTEIALKHAKEEAAMQESASKAKSQFLASMSHEIRTPLNAIIGYIEDLMEEPLASDQKEKLRIAAESSYTLLNLINDLLDFSKIESGKLTIEEVDFNIEQLLKQIFETLAVKIKGKPIVFRYNIEPNTPSWIRGDSLRLNQILINLVGNAIKFTSEGKIEVNVDLMEAPSEKLVLQFSVVDTGIGMKEENLGKIFQSFTQAEASTSRKYGGTGLGLAITKELVELMGGKVWVTSEIGKGSIFSFTLTLKPAETQGELPAQAPVSDIKGAKILLAEDNEVNQKLACMILTRGQAEVTVASSGWEAIEKLKTQTFDLVLMDMIMPELDGLETTRRIRANQDQVLNPQIPIIAMTANAFTEHQKECFDAGMDDFITKPFKKRILYELIAKFIAPAA